MPSTIASLKRTASFSPSEEEEPKKAARSRGQSAEPVMAPSAVDVVMEGNGLAEVNGEGKKGKLEESVLVVGAGPAGLMLATNLVRFGIPVEIIDDRADKTSTGRADGLQPKTIETLKQLRLADSLLKTGVKVYDICFWNRTADSPMSRSSREVHYPEQVDTLDPYILLVHQGMIEDVFLEDLRSRGVAVTRNSPFVQCKSDLKGLVETVCGTEGNERRIHSRFVVGSDGAHSMVRKSIPGVEMVGESGKAAWGVLDGVLNTDFPDIWSKTAIHSEGLGSILCIPRERNMTRLYIELHPGTTNPIDPSIASQDFVMARAQEILAPYSISWASIEWFSIYRVGQRVASSFAFPPENPNTFIVGDASHTHSPKAAQGMNVSMHDAFNLGWKLALAVRNLSLPALLPTFETERRHIAHQLIAFDYEHANAFLAGDADALAKNFDDNIAFISGVGASYPLNVLNIPPVGKPGGVLRAGALLRPTKLCRYIDANPVDVQLDIPLLGQFRIYMFVSSVRSCLPFLTSLCTFISSDASVLGRGTKAAEASYQDLTVARTESDEYLQPGRYTSVSRLFTPALITSEEKAGVELKDLPELLRASPWTFYVDEIGGRGKCCEKYLGGVQDGEVGIVLVRPDVYVGAVGRFAAFEVEDAKVWLDGYFGGFLKD